MTRRKKHVLLAHKLSRSQVATANRVLVANHCAKVSRDAQGLELVNSLTRMDVDGWLRVVGELTAALDGAVTK
jgi:hypothetical protein